MSRACLRKLNAFWMRGQAFPACESDLRALVLASVALCDRVCTSFVHALRMRDVLRARARWRQRNPSMHRSGGFAADSRVSRDGGHERRDRGWSACDVRARSRGASSSGRSHPVSRIRNTARRRRGVAVVHASRPAESGRATGPHEQVRPGDCSPEQIRTAVTALRGRRPRPLDDGAKLRRPAPEGQGAVALGGEDSNPQ